MVEVISEQKWQRLRAWMAQLNINESELDEQFILGSGKGGQKINKTASCVLLAYSKLALQVKCQQSRSREANRYHARVRLCEKVDQLMNQAESKKQREIDKIRKQKRKRRKRQQDIQDKKHRSSLKETRKPPQDQ